MANAVDDILSSLDIEQVAQQVGADPAEVERAVGAALPALFGGLQANAQDPGGASSLLDALGQHDPSLLDGQVDIASIDAQDGEAIAHHIFGDNTDAVYNQLGQYGAAGGLGGSLFRKLLPILAPLVLSYVMKQMTQRTGGRSGDSGSGGGGGFGDILGQVLGGGSASQSPEPDDTVLPRQAPQQPTQSQQTQQTRQGGQPNLDSILQDVLGGAASSQSQRTQAPAGGSIITDILGGLLGGGRR